LIIAENKGSHHALAALLLLKTSGNIIGKGSRINIVTLSESVPDLKNLKRTWLEMLDNPIFREHTEARGEL